MQYAPGNHEGPNRADKGQLGGSCNVTACQLPASAFYFNHSTQAHYCRVCAKAINASNAADAQRLYGHELCTLVEDPEAPHYLAFQSGWGTRGPRSFRHFYYKRKPTVEEAVETLRQHVDRRASAEWFEPHNSGLVAIKAIEWQQLEDSPQ